MAKYIDADKLYPKLDKLHGYYDARQDFTKCTAVSFCIEMLEDMPTADVVEVKHGEWKHSDKARHWTGKDECSVCTYHTYDRDDLSHLNYCPYCGAKMDRGKEE